MDEEEWLTMMVMAPTLVGCDLLFVPDLQLAQEPGWPFRAPPRCQYIKTEDLADSQLAVVVVVVVV